MKNVRQIETLRMWVRKVRGTGRRRVKPGEGNRLSNDQVVGMGILKGILMLIKNVNVFIKAMQLRDMNQRMISSD